MVLSVITVRDQTREGRLALSYFSYALSMKEEVEETADLVLQRQCSQNNRTSVCTDLIKKRLEVCKS